MITEWTGRTDLMYRVRMRLMLIIGLPSVAICVVVLAFAALLFVESVQVHGIWKALEIAGDKWSENHGPGF